MGGPPGLPVDGQGAVERAFAPLAADPAGSAIITDFDGTLAAITSVPADARPVDGAVEALRRLAAVFGHVAVVSGRPVEFLVDRLTSTEYPLPPCRLLGLYGLEQLDDEGVVRTHPDVAPWLPAVARVVERARLAAPTGVFVEEKGPSVTFHWRQAPESAGWAEAFALSMSEESGLTVIHGRLAVELRPPLAIDKGTTVASIASGCRAASYLGDDLGDLPAFEALDDMAAAHGVTVVKVAVLDVETPAELVERADVRIDGPQCAIRTLRWLASEAERIRGVG